MISYPVFLIEESNRRIDRGQCKVGIVGIQRLDTCNDSKYVSRADFRPLD